MNEPKRRGRPPKAHIPAPEMQPKRETLDIESGIDTFSTARAAAEALERVGAEADRKIAQLGAHMSQAYANRVWSGQSPDVPRHERIERVRKALEGQGLSMEGVVL